MIKLLPLILSLVALNSYAKGKIQNEDVKSYADLKVANASITGNLSSGSPCIASPSSVVNIGAGQFVYDLTTPARITVGTTVLGIGTAPCSAGQIKLSANANSTATGDSLGFGGQLSQLISDQKVYISANSLNESLFTAITNGDISGGGSNGFRYVGKIYMELGNGTSVFTNALTSYGDYTLTGSAPTYTATTVAAGFTIAAPSSSLPGLSLTGPSGTYFFLSTGRFRNNGASFGTVQQTFWDGTISSTDANETQFQAIGQGSNCMLFGKIVYGSALVSKQIRIEATNGTSGSTAYIDSSFSPGGVTTHVFYTP